MANNAIKQITIRRGNDHGGIDVNTYDIGGSDSIDAINVNYDDSATQLGVSNVQRAIEQIKSNFQGGVDAVYDAVVAKGSTPASHSLSDVIAGIGNISTGITPTGTFIYTGSEGSWTQDVSIYQYANASNVYNKGYSDGASGVISDVVNISAVSNLEETVSSYTKVFSYTFNKAGIFHICYGHGEATNDDGYGSAVLRCFLGSDQLMQVQIDSNTATSSANIWGNQNPYDREFNVTAGLEFSIYKQENYIEGQSGGTLSGYMAVTGYFKPTV